MDGHTDIANSLYTIVGDDLKTFRTEQLPCYQREFVLSKAHFVRNFNFKFGTKSLSH